jgi:hypothetical protein
VADDFHEVPGAGGGSTALFYGVWAGGAAAAAAAAAAACFAFDEYYYYRSVWSCGEWVGHGSVWQSSGRGGFATAAAATAAAAPGSIERIRQFCESGCEWLWGARCRRDGFWPSGRHWFWDAITPDWLWSIPSAAAADGVRCSSGRWWGWVWARRRGATHWFWWWGRVRSGSGRGAGWRCVWTGRACPYGFWVWGAAAGAAAAAVWWESVDAEVVVR